MGAALEIMASRTNAESYVETIDLLDPDGTPFSAFSDYTYEFSIKGCGADILLTEGNGITLDAGAAQLTITPGLDYRFSVGTYELGFRKKHIASGRVDQDADGTLTVTEGNF